MKYGFKCPNCDNYFERDISIKEYTGKFTCPKCNSIAKRYFGKENMPLAEGLEMDPTMEAISARMKHSKPSDHFKNGSRVEAGKLLY